MERDREGGRERKRENESNNTGTDLKSETGLRGLGVRKSMLEYESVCA